MMGVERYLCGVKVTDTGEMIYRVSGEMKGSLGLSRVRETFQTPFLHES